MQTHEYKSVIEHHTSRQAHRALLVLCHEKIGSVPKGYADKKTWELFQEGRYSCPFFQAEYRKRMPRPKDFNELAEYLSRGFFIKPEYTISMFLFIVSDGIKNENRLPFREDVDAFFEEAFQLSHIETQTIVCDIRNPALEKQGKRELHELCEQRTVSQEIEDALYRHILRTSSSLSKREVAIFEARKIYQIAYYQANHLEEYRTILAMFKA